ncbi:MAG: ABC transporter substrate-binding protein [Cyclobacteriaceae bacterium]
MKNWLFLFVILGCIGCQTPVSENTTSTRGSKLDTKYAEKFEIKEEALIVNEPWPGAVTPKKYTITDAPQRIVVTSTTHLPYLEMLGLEDRLVGFPGTQYISSPKIRERVEAGLITNLGPDGNMNLELLISLEPDLVIAFDMGSESASLDKIEESGIPVIYNADFLETSALGRAEWIKFFGVLFNQEITADSVFNEINSRYDSLKALAGGVSDRPTIFSGVMYGDIWYLPGGQNWAAEFYADAGGNYLWSEDSTGGWLEVSFESVFYKAGQADYWLGTSTFNSKEELLGQDERYGEFEAYKTDQVFNYGKRISEQGGYDFFESAYSRPDIVLADLISILHPELLEGYETYYFQKLQ